MDKPITDRELKEAKLSLTKSLRHWVFEKQAAWILLKFTALRRYETPALSWRETPVIIEKFNFSFLLFSMEKEILE